jgi:hypothetical protein
MSSSRVILDFASLSSALPPAGRAARWLRIALVGLAFALVTATGANAHTRSQSFSSWFVDGRDVRVTYSVQAREVTRLAPLAPSERELGSMLAQHLAPRVALRADGVLCTALSPPTPLAASKGHTRVEFRFECPFAAELAIQNDAFFEVAPSHVHFARVRVAGGPPVEHLFTDARRVRTVDLKAEAGSSSEQQSSGATLASYIELGIEHILIGIDHIAFLIALLLLSRGVRDVVLMVTGFTAGHSITLSLAALGWVRPDIDVIEALIGFTIAIVAAEVIAVATGTSRILALLGAAALLVLTLLSWTTGQGPPAMLLLGLALFTFCYLRLAHVRDLALRLAPALTGLFGLVHGFGFASVLLEIGLPETRLLAALFGFNVGVEIGQLAIVAGVWSCVLGLRRVSRRADFRLGTDALAAGLCGLGIYWFVERAFGGG